MNLPNIKDTLAVLNLMKSAAESLRLLHNESDQEDVDFAHSQHDAALKEYHKLWKRPKRYIAFDLNRLNSDEDSTFTSIEEAKKYLTPGNRIIKITNYKNFYTLFHTTTPGFPTSKAVEEWIDRNGEVDSNECWIIGEVDCDELMAAMAADEAQ